VRIGEILAYSRKLSRAIPAPVKESARQSELPLLKREATALVVTNTGKVLVQ
jgi:hypothetical protein